jgi:hypothetical protein
MQAYSMEQHILLVKNYMTRKCPYPILRLNWHFSDTDKGNVDPHLIFMMDETWFQLNGYIKLTQHMPWGY